MEFKAMCVDMFQIYEGHPPYNYLFEIRPAVNIGGEFTLTNNDPNKYEVNKVYTFTLNDN